MRAFTRRFGPLDAVLVADVQEPPPGRPVCVLLHGFGAPGTDLVPLAGALNAPEGTVFVFPQAPIDLGPAFAGGRAWWQIDMVALQTAMATGRHREMADSVPEGLAEARGKLQDALEAVESGLKPSRWVLGGFSQGAMLSLDYALRIDRKLAGLIAFSGTVIASAEWTERVASRKGTPAVVSHGRQDPVLPFSAAERLRDMLTEGGLQVDFVPFSGGHEIPPPALEAASRLLSRALSGS